MSDDELAFDVVDVFAERPYTGNQLAVVHGAQALGDGQLLAIAREFNYSETTFPTPVGPDRYRVRIFTPGGEIPFAGHPTLGTARVLRDRGELAGDAVVQECGAGEIGVTFHDGLVELQAAPGDLVGPLPDAVADALAADLGFRAGDLVGPAWLAGTGLTFVYLRVRPDAVRRAVVGGRRLSSYAGMPATRDPLEGVEVYAAEPGQQGEYVAVHARVFVPELSVPEDPATGSAAAGLGLVLAATGLLPEGGRYEITQGVEMGRPSLLHGRVEAAGGRAGTCHVSGQVHPVSRGTLRVPPG